MSEIKMLKILFERMKTHPEEFGERGRWMKIINHYEDCLTEEEKRDICDRLKETRRERMNEMLMKELAGESEDAEREHRHPYTTKSNAVTAKQINAILEEGLKSAFNQAYSEKEMEEMHKQYTLEEMRKAFKNASKYDGE